MEVDTGADDSTDDSADDLVRMWPPFGVRVSCGPLTMRVMRDTDFPAAMAVVHAGIHEPDRMPFSEPWTDARGAAAERGFLQHHWRQRATLTAQAWTLELGVWYDDTFVGVQGVGTRDFLVTRTGETGSWLGLAFHRRGIGTLMRQVMCVLCLDHLDFTQVTSAAFTDNPASLGVSRKVGYRPDGVVRMARQGQLVPNVRLVLAPGDLVRPADAVEVTGVGAFRELIGLDGDGQAEAR